MVSVVVIFFPLLSFEYYVIGKFENQLQVKTKVHATTSLTSHFLGRCRIWESEDLQPESDDKAWHELIAEERRAAHVLGYTKQLWNGESDSETEESSGEDKKGSDNTSDASSHGNDGWANLSQEAKNAAITLGYTQAIWDNDGSPPTEDKDWNELSSTERAAAKTLGYTANKWNGEDDSESEASSYNTPITSDGTMKQDGPRKSSKGSVLDQIISQCSFDSSNEGAEATKSSAPSVTGISSGISSLLGFSKAKEDSK